MNAHYFRFGEVVPLESASSFGLSHAQDLIKRAHSARSLAAKTPLNATFPVLLALRELWKPGSCYYDLMLSQLPQVTGFSEAMIKIGLDALQALLDPQFLETKWNTECGPISRDESAWMVPRENRYLRYVPLGVVVHVLSGNVFLVGPSSLIEGILTGNVTLLKLPSGDQVFMPVFMETVLKAESNCGLEGIISGSVSYFSYSSKAHDVINYVKKEVDGIVLWGGEEAVRAYRTDLPARTRFVAFGPKLSLGLVSQAGLEAKGIKETAQKVSLELSLWDQNACTAPQVLFLETGKHTLAFLESCSESLRDISMEIPSGSLDANQAAEIQKIRSVALVDSLLKEEIYFASKDNLDFTVYTASNGKVEPSPLHRTLKVIPYSDPSEVVDKCSELRSYLQTVGLCLDEKEEAEWVDRFCGLGALRLVPFGGMTGGNGLEPHDGQYDLPQLMNLVSHSVTLPRGVRYFETLTSSVKSALLVQAFRATLYCKGHLYSEALYLLRKMRTLDDLVDFPILEKSDFYRFMEREQARFVAKPMSGGFVTRTGGSTGTPQYSYFDQQDWNEMAQVSARVFERCGLSHKSKIANCFLAGDLYGSFISFSAVNEALGATQFALAGKLEPQTLIDCFHQFQVDVIQGLPTVVVPFLRQAKLLCPALTFETMLFAGQPISAGDRDWLEKIMGVKNIISVIGTTEAGMIGYQNFACKGNVHKLVDDYNWIEIVNSKGDPVSFGEVGDICVTTLKKHRLPLVRFRIGDQARFVKSPDGFGRAIEFLGRSDSIIGIGALNIEYSDIFAALGDFPISAMQLVGDYFAESEKLEIHLECDLSLAVDPCLVREVLLSAIPKLKTSLEKKLIYLEILLHGPGVLPRDPRSGKLKNFVDRRFL